MLVFEQYLPAQMSETEIWEALRVLIPTSGGVPQNALKGKLTGMFNKQYPGAFDMALLKKVLDEKIG